MWLAASLTACGSEAHGSCSAVSALLGGETDAADAAVVGVLAGAEACTGTLVTPRGVVTAAHCVLGSDSASVVLGERLDNGGRLSAQSYAHPAYDPQTLDNDVAALVLDVPVTDVAPARVFTGPIASDFVGDPIRLVGFGTNGAKQQGATTIVAVREQDFFHRANPARVCFGDSGGPAFATFDGVEQLIGIASGGDPECRRIGRHERADTYASFFSRILPDWPTTGDIETQATPGVGSPHCGTERTP
jgi:secreted trypsin-like serine protease